MILRVLCVRVMVSITHASAWLPTACASLPSPTMSSSFVGSLLQNSLGINMACRSLGGVALKIDTVEIGHAAGFLSTGRHELEHFCWRDNRKLAGPRRMLLSTRACGGNLFSGSARQDGGMQWQSRNTTDGNYNSRASGVCSATTSAQGVSANKVPRPLLNSFPS